MTITSSSASAIATASLTGALIIPRLLSNSGFLVGEEGVDYYAEIHTTTLNSVVHTLGMPFVAYGALTAVPGLWRGPVRSYHKLQEFVYIAYMSHYITINRQVGIAVSIIYYVPLELARQNTRRAFWHLCAANEEASTEHVVEYDFVRLNRVCYGTLIAFTALLLQEVVGHSMSGDAASRPEGVFNAILYAMYFSVSHLFT